MHVLFFFLLFLEFRAVFCCTDIKTSNAITIDCLKVKQLQCSFGKFPRADARAGLGDGAAGGAGRQDRWRRAEAGAELPLEISV